MREALGVLRYEYLMQIRRWGLWMSLCLTVGFFFFFLLRTIFEVWPVSPEFIPDPWSQATDLIEEFNFFAPIAAGILAADRFTRDRTLGTSELLNSALPTRLPLVLGKYLGSVFAILTPTCVMLLGILTILAFYYHLPAIFLTGPVVLLAVVLPSWLFVVAWSLLFPLVLPLRLYQVLFAGFWMWAVAVPPDRLPTINWSIFGVQGQYAHFAFFLQEPGQIYYVKPPATVGWAIVNMSLILGLSIAALALLPLVLRWQEQRA